MIDNKINYGLIITFLHSTAFQAESNISEVGNGSILVNI